MKECGNLKTYPRLNVQTNVLFCGVGHRKHIADARVKQGLDRHGSLFLFPVQLQLCLVHVSVGTSAAAPNRTTAAAAAATTTTASNAAAAAAVACKAASAAVVAVNTTATRPSTTGANDKVAAGDHLSSCNQSDACQRSETLMKHCESILKMVR